MEQPSLPFEEDRFESLRTSEYEVKRTPDNKSVIFTHFDDEGKVLNRISVPRGSLGLPPVNSI